MEAPEQRPDAGGRTAVVAGASGGIGEALARGFLEAGYAVIGADRAAPAWTAPGFRHVPLDVTDSAATEAFGRSLDRVDVLVNAAGIIRRAEEFDLATFTEVVDINLGGSMRMAMACRPALARSGAGAILNIGSMYSFLGGGHAPAYSASKGGVVQLTKALAVAFARDNIRVNALAPGWIETRLTAPIRADEKRNRGILDRTPLGRWGTPADLIGPALFLAGSASAFVTGVVLPVDGGYLLT
ncbi:MAG TPA: SDR family oxidoreductase [Bauldia sp.]|nr:SDR family oxidoreductase [Bauldia sp.]